MRRLIGFIAVVLGFVGVLTCLAGAVLVWPASDKYLGRAMALVEEARGLLVDVGGHLGRVRLMVNETSARVAQVRITAEDIAMQEDTVDRARLDALIAELSPRIEQAEVLTQTLRSTALTMRNYTDIASGFTFDPAKAQQLRDVSEALEKTALSLQYLEGELIKIRQGERTGAVARGVANLASEVEPSLIVLEQRIAQVNDSVTRTENEVTELGQLIEYWQRWGPWVVTGVLAWFGLAQWCLLARGWTMLLGRARS